MDFKTMNIGFPKTDFMQNSSQNWMMVYTMCNNRTFPFPSMEEKNTRKRNIIFRTNKGRTNNIIIEEDKTIQDLFIIYFKKINKPELINRERDIYFIYNASKIDIHEKRTVGEYFKFSLQPIIYANDVGDLIGALYY